VCVLAALALAVAALAPLSAARAAGETAPASAVATVAPVGDAAPDAAADDALDLTFASAAFPGLVWVDTLVILAAPILATPFPLGAGVITSLDLRDEPTGRDLATLLSSTAGLQVRRLGADGASAIPSLRGGSAAQVRLFLDGMPLPDAWDGGAALDMVPAERLTAVEIHRGVVPVALGGAGGIGAINLLTSRVPGHPFVEAAVGSFGARSLRAGTAWLSGDGLSGLDVMAHARRAENDFKYLDHRQTFHNDADDSVRTRANARVNEWGGWVGANRLAGRVSLRAGAGYLHRDGGRPGPLTYLTPHAKVRFERGDLRLRADLDHGLLTADVAAGRGDDRLYDPEGEFQRADPGVSRSLAHDLGSRVAWSPWRGRVVAPSLGVTWRRQWQQDAFEDEVEPERRRTQAGVFAALELTVGRVRLTPAWRWQHTTDEFPFVPRYPWEKLPPAQVRRDDRSPSVGAVWEALTGRLFVEAHAARASREPSWVELFGVRGGIDGNRDLKPETITSYDAAVTWRPGDGRWEARLAAFDAASDDKIIYVQHNQNASWAVNIGAARTRGLECEVAVGRQDLGRVTGNLTWQDARDRSGLPATDGKPLPFLPPVEARLYATLAAKGWTPWAELTYQAANSRDRIDTEIGRAPARTRLNLGLGRPLPAPGLGRSVTLHVSAVVENVTDSSVYDVEGFPLPGRTWRLTVALRGL
jgi:iron complex outermembrane receptor protein